MAPERSMVDTLAMLDEALKRLAAAKYSAFSALNTSKMIKKMHGNAVTSMGIAGELDVFHGFSCVFDELRFHHDHGHGPRRG